MASTFAELYSDFLDSVKIYTEKLDETELMFMRRFTRGMQIFQRETEYIDMQATVLRQTVAPFFTMPFTALRIIEIRDASGRVMLLNETVQYGRNLDAGYYSRTPHTFDLMQKPYSTPTRLVTNIGRELILQNDDPATDTQISVYFIPDLPAFTQPDQPVPTPARPWEIWTAWYPIDTNFFTMFTTRRLVPQLRPYENAFTDYAIASYLKSVGSVNYRVYEESFYREIERSKMNKPLNAKEQGRDYTLALWS